MAGGASPHWELILIFWYLQLVKRSVTVADSAAQQIIISTSHAASQHAQTAVPDAVPRDEEIRTTAKSPKVASDKVNNAAENVETAMKSGTGALEPLQGRAQAWMDVAQRARADLLCRI